MKELKHQEVLAILQKGQHYVFYPDMATESQSGRYCFVQGDLYYYFRLDAENKTIKEMSRGERLDAEQLKRFYYIIETNHVLPHQRASLALLEKFKQTLASFDALLQQLKEGPAFCWIEKQVLLSYTPLYEWVSINTSYESPKLSRFLHWDQLHLLGKLWFGLHPEVFTQSKEWEQLALPYLTWFYDWVEQVKQGKKILLNQWGDISTDNHCYVYLGEKWLCLNIKKGKINLENTWNPALCITEQKKVISFIEESYDAIQAKRPVVRLALSEPLPGLEKAVPFIENGLKKTKEEMILLYLQKMQANGLEIGGGPTTDQQWRMYFQNGKYYNRYYRPKGEYDLEQVVDEISEEKVRETLLFYSMFGLQHYL